MSDDTTTNARDGWRNAIGAVPREEGQPRAEKIIRALRDGTSPHSVSEEEVEAAAHAIFEHSGRSTDWISDDEIDLWEGRARAALEAAARIRTDRETAED